MQVGFKNWNHYIDEKLFSEKIKSTVIKTIIRTWQKLAYRHHSENLSTPCFYYKLIHCIFVIRLMIAMLDVSIHVIF